MNVLKNSIVLPNVKFEINDFREYHLVLPEPSAEIRYVLSGGIRLSRLGGVLCFYDTP